MSKYVTGKSEIVEVRNAEFLSSITQADGEAASPSGPEPTTKASKPSEEATGGDSARRSKRTRKK